MGKTYWLRHHFQQKTSQIIDLLQTDIYAEYITQPSLLRERWLPGLTVIDEVQKVPALLDEVHWLIENRDAQFLLTGSSARKLRRNQANLLGGRAWRYELGPLSYQEVDGFELEEVFISGLIAPHFTSPDPTMDLRSYVADYLKEEIVGEALTRNVPAFSGFLRIVGISNGQLISYTNIAREAGVSAKVIRSYFEILEDTLLGFRLQPWTRARHRRLITTDKFFLFDVGVANHLARRKPARGTPEFGTSFEHFILMELLSYRRYRSPDLEVRFWRAASGVEVDFVLGDMQVAIEVKSTTHVQRGHLRSLRLMRRETAVPKSIVVSLDREPRTLEDDIRVLPWRRFLEELWAGEVI